jgi:hypothetical protein
VPDSSKPPIFIVGSPRSGTTLLRNLLSRHPSIAICGETRFFANIYRYRSAFGSLENIENRKRLVDQSLGIARMKRLEMDLEELRPLLMDRATSYAAFFQTVMQAYANLKGKERYGEKTPHHAFYTELLSEWYPGAPLIHLVRDPRDVVASLQRMPWSPKSILNNSSIWVLFNRAVEKSRHRPEYLLVHYERLVESPDRELARICEHIGEVWPDSVEVPTGSDDAYSWPRSTKGPVTRERLQKWKQELSPGDVALVERVVGARLESYGYESSGASASLPETIQALAIAGFDMARKQVREAPAAWTRLTRPSELSLHEYLKNRHVWDVMFPNIPPPVGHSK